MSQVRFYYAGLDFEAQKISRTDNTEVGGVEKTRDTLEEYVEQRDMIIDYDGSEWRLGASDFGYDGFIVGQFGKRYDDESETYDESEEMFKQDRTEDVAESSLFLVHPESGFIAFNQRQRIGYKQFTGAFSKGYNQFCEIPNALRLPFLSPSGELDRIIAETEVKSLDFKLKPTNPYPDEEMEDLDEEIKDMGAEEVGLNPMTDGGLNTENQLISSALAFSRSKYGDVRVVYKEDGDIHEFDTRDRPASIKVPRPSDITGLVEVSNEIIEKGQSLVQ